MQNLTVFYNQNQSVSDNISFSPSAGKPALIAELFNQYDNVHILSDWQPVKRQDFYLAHDKDYVDGVLDCQVKNGFHNKLPSVAASLYWTTGSFFQASKYALENKTVAMSPTSGFHHACYRRGEGFCTFNGLMVAAILLKQQYDLNKIGIIDFDAHYGNGTVSIINEKEIDYIEHVSFGDLVYQGLNNFDKWIENLENDLEKQFKNCDIIFYQAGADPHIDDPLGGYLTTEQMRLRDKVVFAFAKKNNLPIVWNLAGGYQEPIEKVLSLHENTLKECLNHYLGNP
jgi:acetoin utilization deacetylase AcuC-like enzyme